MSRSRYSTGTTFGDLVRGFEKSKVLSGGGIISASASDPGPGYMDPDGTAGSGTTLGAPGNLILTSGAVMDPVQGRFTTTVTASWDVVYNNHPSEVGAGVETGDPDASPVADYGVSHQIGSGPWSREAFSGGATTLNIPHFHTGITVNVRVRARTASGQFGGYTSGSLLLTKDTVGPNTPSNPTLYGSPQTLSINWDGLDSVGGVMPADYLYTAIHLVSGTSNFTPSAANKIGQFGVGGGTHAYHTAGTTSATFAVKLIAYDQSKNASGTTALVTGSTTAGYASGSVVSLSSPNNLLNVSAPTGAVSLTVNPNPIFKTVTASDPANSPAFSLADGTYFGDLGLASGAASYYTSAVAGDVILRGGSASANVWIVSNASSAGYVKVQPSSVLLGGALTTNSSIASGGNITENGTRVLTNVTATNNVSSVTVSGGTAAIVNSLTPTFTSVTTTANVLIGTGGLLDLSSAATTAAAGGAGVGDKIALYQNVYGFGIQASRIVAFVPAAAAFSVRPVAASGQASSATDAITLFASGASTFTGAMTLNSTLAVGSTSTFTGRVTANDGLAVSGTPSVFTNSGNIISVAYNGATADNFIYGIVGVTAPAGVSTAYYSMTAYGQAVFGIGMGSSNAMRIGSVGTGKVMNSTSLTIDASGNLIVPGTGTVNGVLVTTAGAETFQLKATTQDHAYMGFYARSAAQGQRSGYFGYPGAASTILRIQNELAVAGADVIIGTASGGGSVFVANQGGANGRIYYRGTGTTGGRTASNGYSIIEADLAYDTITGAAGAGVGSIAPNAIYAYNIQDGAIIASKLSLPAIASVIASGAGNNTTNSFFRFVWGGTGTPEYVDPKTSQNLSHILANGQGLFVSDPQAYQGYSMRGPSSLTNGAVFAYLQGMTLPAGIYNITVFLRVASNASSSNCVTFFVSTDSGGTGTYSVTGTTGVPANQLSTTGFMGYSFALTVNAGGATQVNINCAIATAAGTDVFVSHITGQPVAATFNPYVSTVFTPNIFATAATISTVSATSLTAGLINVDDIYLGSSGHIYAGQSKLAGRLELNGAGLYAFQTQNLFSVASSSFEAGGIGQWGGVGATLTNDTNGAADGTKALKVTPNAASADAYATQDITVTAGTQYTVSGTVYNPLAQTGTIDTRARTITVYIYDAGNALLTGFTGTQSPNTANQTRVTTTFTVPAGGVKASVRAYVGATNVGANAQGNAVYWDAFQFEVGSQATVFTTNTSALATTFQLTNNGRFLLTNAPTGARMELTPDGLNFFNSSSVKSIALNAADGSFVIGPTSFTNGTARLTNTRFTLTSGSGVTMVDLDGSSGSAIFQGTMYANQGYIGTSNSGWKFDAGAIFSSSGGTFGPANSVNLLNAAGGGPYISVNGNSGISILMDGRSGQNPFGINSNSVTVFSVDQSGNSFQNGTHYLRGNMILDGATNSHIEVGNSATASDSYVIVRRPAIASAGYNGSNAGQWVMLDGRAGTSTALASSTGQFSVTYDGILTCTAANISGTVTATAGAIGGWTLSSTAISYNAGSSRTISLVNTTDGPLIQLTNSTGLQMFLDARDGIGGTPINIINGLSQSVFTVDRVGAVQLRGMMTTAASGTGGRTVISQNGSYGQIATYTGDGNEAAQGLIYNTVSGTGTPRVFITTLASARSNQAGGYGLGAQITIASSSSGDTSVGATAAYYANQHNFSNPAGSSGNCSLGIFGQLQVVNSNIALNDSGNVSRCYLVLSPAADNWATSSQVNDLVLRADTGRVVIGSGNGGLIVLQTGTAGNTHLDSTYNSMYFNWFRGAHSHTGNGSQAHGISYASAFTVSSARALKHKIRPSKHGLSTIKKMAAVEFEFDNAGARGRKHLGFIADDMEAVLPHAVHRWEASPAEPDESKRIGIDQAALLAVTIQAMQELAADVEALHLELALLKKGK